MFRRLQPVKIDFDPMAVTCKTSHVAVRLERIAENYRQLDLLLTDVEARLPGPEPVEVPLHRDPMPEAGKSIRKQKPR